MRFYFKSDYEYSDDLRKLIATNALMLSDAAGSMIALMGSAPSKTKLIEGKPQEAGSSGSSSSTTASADAAYDIPRRVALGVARQFVKETPAATAELVEAELDRRGVRQHLPPGREPLLAFLSQAGLSLS